MGTKTAKVTKPAVFLCLGFRASDFELPAQPKRRCLYPFSLRSVEERRSRARAEDSVVAGMTFATGCARCGGSAPYTR